MRFIIYGAGAVGGTIGSRLHQHKNDVLLIARGDHYEALKNQGLTFVSPVERITQAIAVVKHPSEITFRQDDVVLLTMKTQHTREALLELRAAAGINIPIICAQNGVENERLAQRFFNNVYGMVVLLPANHFAPGIVECNSANKSGVLDAGKYPTGTDALIETVTRTLNASNFSAKSDQKIMRWKYKKLLLNLNNALQAIAKSDEDTRALQDQVLSEALAVYSAANIDFVSDAEDIERRSNHIQMKPIDGIRRGGGSSWQSLKNAKGDIESAYLNGEIVLLGHQYGVPTPANTALQYLAGQAARQGIKPGSISIEEIQAAMKR